MTDDELDGVYTRLCETLTRLGPTHAELYLARLALLALTRFGDAATANELLDAAAQDLQQGAAGAAPARAGA